MIDSHQHFWNYKATEYPWITPELGRLKRDFLPRDLELESVPLGIAGSVAVQARQTLAETRWLLGLAGRHPSIRGVVGWVDLRAKRLERTLQEFKKSPRFVGLRHLLQDEPDKFMLEPAFQRGLSRLREFNLTYDLLIFPKQLPPAIRLAAQFPEQKFVLDHLAKPLIRAGVLSPWREQIRALAKSPNVFCKISGLVTEAQWNQWRAADFRPYLETVWEAFGEDRVMFGSDWPVCLLASSYQEAFGVVFDFFLQFTPAAREKFFGANAIDFYGLNLAQTASRVEATDT